jgi:hypothetical protein
LCGDEPENTLAAYLQCQARGVPMVEVDVRQTADRALVLMHDSDVIRTTDGESRFPGRTEVSALTLEEFRSLIIDDPRCVGDPTGAPDRCHPAVLLDLLQRTGDGLLLDVDFKDGDAAALAALIARQDAQERVLFFDSDLARLRAYRAVIPQGLVMPRAQEPGDFATLLEQTDLDLRWIHGDPGHLPAAEGVLAPAGVRLYLNGFTLVDPWLLGASLAESEASRSEMLRSAWEALDGLRGQGADAFGTDYAVGYAGHFYPAGFGR